ncbi:hypothetical protein V5P93_006466 [Actinokineospora auranticolor]|uniref:NADH:quinone oxidoreductase/Mrp antiporter membrane subunit domain-containing protein n=1 Tax=Actinokineospora auranticolor TaxID=155976 RepID=A0A2S6GXC8_9PSEU|nr:hypothetical protein [Actinokineospora auranticolor]PPK69895.1 hypothetical protein CLV40_103505 [Actinokineospora auranticolor]
MIALVPLAAAALWLAAAAVAGRAPDTRSSRRAATRVGSAAVATSVLGLLLPDTVSTWQVTASTVAVSLAGLMVAAMSPVATHTPAVLARALAVVSISCGLLAFRVDGVDVLLWAVSAWLVWSALRGRADGLDRLFVVYQAPAVLLLGLGEVLPGALGDVVTTIAVVTRLAVIPLHGWLPRFVDRAPVGLVVAFVVTPVPVPSAVVGMWLGAATALLGALVAVSLADARKALGYLLISVHGLLLVGASQAVVAVSAAALTMTVGAVAARRDGLLYGTPGGDLARTPRLAFAYLVFGLALAGFPLLPGFADEHHYLNAAPPLVVACAIAAMALVGITAMRGFLGLFTHAKAVTGERDLTPLENYAVALALAVLALTGIAPGLLPSTHVEVTAER